MTAAYLKLSGEKTGEIRGPVRDRHLQKTAALRCSRWSTASCHRGMSATGQATGRRQHLPIALHQGDGPIRHRSSISAIARNELILTVEIVCLRDRQPARADSGREILSTRSR